MAKPLQGVRVLDMSHVIAGPLASYYLAQLGAEVIKIESPQGGDVMRASKAAGDEDDTPAVFAALNAGKRSFAVDIRKPEGAHLVRELARSADVFIENFRPGVVARHGLDHAAIQAVRPDVVYCSISGYGQQGEWSQRGAYDHVIQALTGMMMMSGDDAGQPPVKVGFAVVDVAVGMLGALSVVAALHRRQREGVGQYIDASMVQASLMLMYPNASSFLTGRIEPQRVGNRGYTGSPTADTYRCRDGWLATAANTPAQFRKFAAVLGLDGLCEDGAALDLDAFNAPGGGFVVARNLPYLRQRFSDVFSQSSAADMELRLNAAGVPAARVRRLGEFLDEVEAGGGGALPLDSRALGSRQLRTAGIGFRYREDGQAADAGAPSLGQDTDGLLAEMGLSAVQIRGLREASVVG
jgi:crotonobetainyl-CoA:carnitine CoA-transferase CaiB-like acyl-CoA transferase